jgi:DNA-binding response OmpR family regulator
MQSVLIIDDQQDLLDITRIFLERFGNMHVETVTSAKHALMLTRDKSFDAIVVDYDMPEINGIEFLKILRAKGDTTPIIIFTGVGGEHTAMEALNNGADFFLQKGEDPPTQFRNLVHMVNQAVERRSMGCAIGTSQRLLAETIAFFPEPAYAIDREGKVIAWNKAMAEFTGTDSKKILGRGDGEYAIPFFGRKTPMLSDLVFEDEAMIEKNGYTIINREQGTLFAWTKARGKKGEDKVLWMKAAALHDGKGVFIGTLGSVRDITDELGPELLRQSAVSAAHEGVPAPPLPASMRTGLDKLLGRAKSQYKKGLRLYYREGNYADAIQLFDQALEIDPSLAYAWHDRGICLRQLGRDEEALKNFDRAIALAPDDEELAFTRADLLRKIGILQEHHKVLEAAARAYNRVVEINPDHADAWNGLGICMKELGKDELSRQYFERAQDLVRWGKSRKKTRNLDSLV